MEDHVYSRYSIMNRNEECLIDKKMIKSEFLTSMDKPLDLKQNVISDKTMKNFDSKSEIKVKSDLDTTDSSPDFDPRSQSNLNMPTDSNHKKFPMYTGQLVHGSSLGNTDGSGFGYSSNFVQGQAFVVNGVDSEAVSQTPVYAADLSALYNGGFLQLQNIQTSEEVVVIATEADTSGVVGKSETHDCPICQKTFNNKHNLAKHINLHTGTEKFQCSVCQKKFSEKGNMTKHMNIHTGSKTYNCPVCNKTFFWLSSLSKHKALHTGERVGKYECPICKKAFGEKGNLTKHMNVHTGNRMFACDVCNKGFYWKSSLIMHRTIHTGHKMYACPTCDKRFRWKTSFNKHMTAHLQVSQLSDQRATS